MGSNEPGDRGLTSVDAMNKNNITFFRKSVKSQNFIMGQGVFLVQ